MTRLRDGLESYINFDFTEVSITSFANIDLSNIVINNINFFNDGINVGTFIQNLELVNQWTSFVSNLSDDIDDTISSSQITDDIDGGAGIGHRYTFLSFKIRRPHWQ